MNTSKTINTEGFCKLVLVEISILLILMNSVSSQTDKINRVVIILVDGSRGDGLYGTSLAGTKYLLEHGVSYNVTESSFPTITPSAHATIYTGSFPKNTGITGYRYFDRNSEKYRDHNEFSDQVRLTLGWDLQSSTLFETAPSEYSNKYSFLEFISTGASYEIVPLAMWYYNLKPDKDNQDFLQGDDAVFSEVKNCLKYPLLCNLASNDFDLMAVWVPGIDESSHMYGPKSPEVAEIYSNLGQEFTDFTNFLDKDLGVLDDTLIVIVSDHGQTQVVDDSFHAVGRSELEILLSGVGYSVSGDYGLSDAVVASNGGMAMVYVRDINHDWSVYPSLSVLQPALDEFVVQPFVEDVLVRVEGGEYQVYDGGGLQPLSVLEGKYPSAVERVEGLNSGRSGDIILLANYGDGFYFEDEPKLGVHGNLNWEDTYVPLIFSNPGMGSCSLSGARNVDIAPTIADLMGFRMDGVDGVSLAGDVLTCFKRGVGEELVVNVSVGNSGPGIAGGFTVSFYDGDPESSGVLIGEESVGLLGVNQTVWVSTTWTPQSTGGHEVYVLVDELNTVIETDESDNTGFMGQEVILKDVSENPTAGVETEVESFNPVNILSTLVSDPKPGGTDDTIGKFVDLTADNDFIEASVKISYDEASLNVREESLKMYFWDGSGWVPVARSGVNTLENYVWAYVGHFSTYTAIGATKPDLNISLDLNSTSVREKDPVSVSISVSNTGDAPSQDCVIEAYILDDYNVTQLETGDCSLGAGGSTTLDFNLYLNKSGRYTIFAQASGTSEEHDESDNIATDSITVYERDKVRFEVIEAPTEVERYGVFTYTVNATCLKDEGCENMQLILDPIPV